MNGQQQRHVDNRKLMEAGLARNQAEADSIRKQLGEEGRPIDDYITETPEPASYDAGVAGASPGDVHIHMVLHQTGRIASTRRIDEAHRRGASTRRIDEDLVSAWLQAQLAGSPFFQAQIVGVKKH